MDSCTVQDKNESLECSRTKEYTKKFLQPNFFSSKIIHFRPFLFQKHIHMYIYICKKLHKIAMSAHSWGCGGGGGVRVVANASFKNASIFFTCFLRVIWCLNLQLTLRGVQKFFFTLSPKFIKPLKHVFVLCSRQTNFSAHSRV